MRCLRRRAGASATPAPIRIFSVASHCRNNSAVNLNTDDPAIEHPTVDPMHNFSARIGERHDLKTIELIRFHAPVEPIFHFDSVRDFVQIRQQICPGACRKALIIGGFSVAPWTLEPLVLVRIQVGQSAENPGKIHLRFDNLPYGPHGSSHSRRNEHPAGQ